MAKKNIIKLNEQYFSCNPIENFDDTSKINSEVETETSQDETPANLNMYSAQDNTNEDSTSKKTYRTRVRSKKRSKKGSRRRSNKGSKKASKKPSKKSSKKTKEGFCAGNTCLTESNLKSLIKLLKKLELKK